MCARGLRIQGSLLRAQDAGDCACPAFAVVVEYMGGGTSMSYRVRLNVFEGPFDLLVYLIEHAQMSIYDIRISEIT